MEEKSISHDQLQYKCHWWLWNTYPNLRYLFHTNINDIKIIEKVLRAVTYKSIGNDARRIILSQLKSIGMVPGTWDFEFLYNGILNYIEIKVGHDDISLEQRAFNDINVQHGARFFIARTEEEFRDIIENKVLKV